MSSEFPHDPQDPTDKADPGPTLSADAQPDETRLLGDQPTVGAPAGKGMPAADSATAKTVGPYRMVRRIGQGGMGEVWLAEQVSPVRRRVALKLIKGGQDSGEFVARFAYERQALALMEHPAIARVYDAGSTSEGQPYFGMEYVDGLPITRYCDEHRLTVAGRIELFIRVCEGVQHAHQKAILHRDLKPSNVLVAEHDGRATPKIIDFGLAKAIGPTPADTTMMTQVGTIVGTPLYMSPEQAGADRRNIDTRTDVYSLGVILYELLVGATPFDISRLALDEFLRVIREVDPPRPSTRLLQLEPQALHASVELRSTSVSALRRQLSSDLDWIVLKTLEKDPERRYASPSELAGDLNNWLQHEPVVARPPTTAYRVGKFVRRHRLGVGFAGALTVLLVAFAVTMAVQAVRIARERDRANHNAEVADRNRAEATKQAQIALSTIYQVVTNTDEQLRTVGGTEALRKQLLDSAMKNLDDISRSVATSSWADRTMGVALQRMADFYGQTGTMEQQVQALERSLQIFDRLMREDPNQDWPVFDAAVSYDDLGELGRETGPDPGQIYHYYEESLALRQRLVANVHQPQPSVFQRRSSLAISNIKVASLAWELHDPEKALTYAQRAVSTASDLGSTGGSQTDVGFILASTYRTLGDARAMAGQTDAAREAFGQALDLLRKFIEAEPLNVDARKEVGRIQLAVGDLELDLGHLDASLSEYRAAEASFAALIKKDTADLELQWYRANTQYAMGRALSTAGRTTDAQEYFRQILPTRKALLASDPKNIQRRIELMLTTAQLGQRDEVVADAPAVEAYAPHNPSKLFLAACAYALISGTSNRSAPSGEVRADTFASNAIRLLQAAIKSGFHDRWALEHAQELQNIRGMNAFKQLAGELSAR